MVILDVRAPEGAEPCKREGRVAAMMLPGLEMVADKDQVKARLLRETGELEQFQRPKLLRRRFISKLQHCPPSEAMGPPLADT